MEESRRAVSAAFLIQLPRSCRIFLLPAIMAQCFPFAAIKLPSSGCRFPTTEQYRYVSF